MNAGGRERPKGNEYTEASGSNGIDDNNACKRYIPFVEKTERREAATTAAALIASSIANRS